MLGRNKHRGVEQIKSRAGLVFVSPWIIGFVVFFATPIINSLLYSFSDVTLSEQGVVTKFIGIESYKYYLMEDPDFLNKLSQDLLVLLYSLPIIILLSLVLALFLNQKFKGRLFFRALYFMPVIIASGVVIELLFQTSDKEIVSAGVNTAITDSMFEIDEIIEWLNLPSAISEYVETVIKNIFDLLWGCGIQTVLYIAGLQSIPHSLYEAARVEGTTKWEEFWYITFPMLNSITLLVLVFTIVDQFTNTRRNIIDIAYSRMDLGIYDTTSTILWIYFAVVAFIMGILIFCYTRYANRWQ